MIIGELIPRIDLTRSTRGPVIIVTVAERESVEFEYCHEVSL